MIRGLLVCGIGLLLLGSCTSVSPGFEREIRQLPTSSTAPNAPAEEQAPPPKTGMLFLRVLPATPGLELQLDGRAVHLGSETIPIGTHRLTWRQFGYREGERNVVVEENRTTFVDLYLVPAEFALTQLAASRGGRINPDLAGAAGRVTLAFHANAPGTARLEVTSPDGREVFSRQLVVDTWTISTRWDATHAGTPLPDGTYLVRLNGTDTRGSPIAESTVTVTLDRSLPVYQPGTWAIPAADAADPGVLQSHLGVSAHGGPVDGLTVWDNTVDFATSFGLLPGWELLTEVSGRAVSSSEFISGDVQVGLSWNLWRTSSTSANVRVLAGSAGPTIGAVGALYAGAWSVLGLVGSSSSPLGIGGEIRGGVRWSPGPLSAEVSGTFNGGPPTVVSRLALELDAEGALSVGLLVKARAYAWNDWIFYGGLGVSFALDTLDIASW